MKKLAIIKLVNSYEVEPIILNEESILFRIDIYSNGSLFFPRLTRYEFYRLMPSFPQLQDASKSISSDEMVSIRDSELGGVIAKIKESSEESALNKALNVLSIIVGRQQSESDLGAAGSESESTGSG